MANSKLSPDAKMFIVQSLACFDSPAMVAEALKESHGVTVSRQLVETYDPMKAAGSRLSEKHRIIFEATRAAYLEDIGKIGIVHMSVRLRMLQRLFDKAEERGDGKLMLQILEQAAKEVGGYYGNRQHVVHSGGFNITVSQEDAQL